jgi:hypothetical protein
MKCILIREVRMTGKSGTQIVFPIMAILMLVFSGVPATADGHKPIAAVAPVVTTGVPEKQVTAINAGLQEIIGMDHDLVAESRYVEVAEQVTGQLGLESCDSEACLREVLAATEADILYTLRVDRDGYFSTFWMTRVGPDGVAKRKAQCGRCSAREMGKTAKKMVERME